MRDTNAQYRITGRESLNMLLTKRRRRYAKFVIDVANMNETKARSFENELNKFHTSCGCTTGNYFISITLVLFAAYFYLTGQTINNWKIIIQGVIIFLIAAFIGKLIGKFMDAYKFRKTIKSIYQELA